jgi:hypothetical protein
MEYLYGLGGAVSGSMAGNGLVQSGLMLLVMGSMLNYVRTFVAAVWDFICRRFFIEVELTQQEDAYRWLMIWVRGSVAQRWLVVFPNLPCRGFEFHCTKVTCPTRHEIQCIQ